MRFGGSNPAKVLARSWLVDPDRRGRLDGDVRVRLNTARKMRGLDARELPFSVAILAERTEKGVRYRQWFVATSACALLGELLFASEEVANPKRPKATGIYKVPPLPRRKNRRGDQRNEIHRPLAALRNACFHPALVIGEGKHAPAMHGFAQALAVAQNTPLKEYVEKNWSGLHTPAIAAWAIARVDRAGRYDLGELGQVIARH